MHINLQARAKELGKKTEFDAMYNAFKNLHKKYEKEKDSKPRVINNRDNQMQYKLLDTDYPTLNCGTWECDMSGVRTFTMFGEVTACYNPVLPVKRLINLQTGDEKTVIAFYKDGRWKEIIVENSLLLNANKIIMIVR